MYLSKLRVDNYKSFRDSGELTFESGINIVVGQNNAGKTALLEALSLNFDDKGHRSERTQPRRNVSIKEESQVHLSIKISGDELKQSTKEINRDIFIPAPADGQVDSAISQFNGCLVNGISISSTVGASGIITSSLSHGLYKEKESGPNNFMKIALGDNDKFVHKGMDNQKAAATLGRFILDTFMKRIYRFYAERPNVGRCPVGYSRELKQDASNLAEVLQVLQTTNTRRFDRFNRLVMEIFPSVKWVSAVTEDNILSGTKVIDLKVWPVDPNTERDYLAIPLRECGTGIGQVLSILYIIVDSEEPRTIIIDEPQSFLHPGAAKKLVELLKQHQEHQYFISTHSPEIIAASNPSTVTALEYIEGETVPRTLNLDQTEDLKYVLDVIGVRFGDVFVADNILWVEGPTEFKAFPLIIKRFAPEQTFSNLTVLPLTHTGDLKSKKHARLILDIYKRLSGAHALVPPTVGIILDREGMSKREIAEFRGIGEGLLELLPRRMFENYLLDAEAIAAIYNRENSGSNNPALITSEDVSMWVKTVRDAGDYLDKTKETPLELSDKEWLKQVDGAKLLQNLFHHFSNGETFYFKPQHSIELTEWLLEHKAACLHEVWDLLDRVLRKIG